MKASAEHIEDFFHQRKEFQATHEELIATQKTVYVYLNKCMQRLAKANRKKGFQHNADIMHFQDNSNPPIQHQHFLKN